MTPLFGQDQPDIQTGNLPQPTAEEVFTYVELISNHPETPREEAIDILGKWMGGELERKEFEIPDAQDFAEAHPGMLDSESLSSSILSGSTDQCLLCIGGCCAAFFCDPYCLAACVAGVCK